MKRVSGLTAALFLTATVAAQADTLPPDPGRDMVAKACAQCHSADVVSAQRKTRADWSATIDRILEKYPYEPLEAQEREVILDYLAKQYGPNVP